VLRICDCEQILVSDVETEMQEVNVQVAVRVSVQLVVQVLYFNQQSNQI